MRLIFVLAFSVLFFVAGCSTHVGVPGTEPQTTGQSGLAALPNWYHPNVGYHMPGKQIYPDYPPLAKLLKEADKAFMKDNLASCQTLLERAQRIGTRETSVYVRLSYLYWVQNKTRLAEQMARRALAVLGADAIQKREVGRLLTAIQSN